VRVGALGERGNGGLVAVWRDALLEIVEGLSESDGLDVVCERESFLGSVAGGVDLAALKVRDRKPVGAQRTAAVRQDIAEYQLATGIRRGLLFPRDDGEPWREHDYRNWRRRVYQPIARRAGLPQPRPYDLRNSYVSLLAAAGYTLLEVSRRAGHTWTPVSATTRRSSTTSTPARRVDPEDAIRAARARRQRRAAAVRRRRERRLVTSYTPFVRLAPWAIAGSSELRG
jgi:hypothetical protein